MLYENMNQISNYDIFNKIDTVVCIASKYGGKVFGKYVKSVIVPREHYINNIPCDHSDQKYLDFLKDISVKNVNIWFKSDYNADLFISEMGERFYFKEKCSFDVLKYSFYNNNGKFIVYFNIFISHKFPANEFDIDYLVYYYNSNNLLFSKSYNKLYEANTLKKNILKKEVRMLQDLQNLFNSSSSSFIFSKEKEIFKKYINKGWKIFVQEKVFSGNGKIQFFIKEIYKNRIICNCRECIYCPMCISNKLNGVNLEKQEKNLKLEVFDTMMKALRNAYILELEKK